MFRGGWTLEAAEQVAGADLDPLESLGDKSLVRHAGDRFWMLETIREYASEKLEASNEAADPRRRHADHFLALAEAAEPKLRAEELSGGRLWLDRQRSSSTISVQRSTFLKRRKTRSSPYEWLPRLQRSGRTPPASSSLVQEGRGRLERALQLDPSPTLASRQGPRCGR